MDCPQCGTGNPDGANFCLGCGARLARACPRCGTDLPLQARFCIACGAPVNGVPAKLPPAQAEEPPGAEIIAARLQRLVPKEYAERLLATRGRAGSERRMVTILFSDVKGSTAMADHLDPEEVLEVMNGAFDVLIEPVTRHEGTLARLMGDAVLAFFGAPLAHEDDPERAVRAALEIVAGAHRYAQRLERERHLPGFNVRVGIHTGLVVAGEVGTDLRVEYTAMGDAANLAARMEQAAPPGSILITHDTYRHVRGLFDVQSQPLLAVEGKTEPVQTYLVQRAKPRAFRKPMRGVEGVETRMVGRESELKHLQEAFRTVMEDGELQVVTVCGEAGVGKSRLLHELDIWSELLPERFLYFKGRALQETQNLPYGLIRDLVSFRLQILDSDPPEVVRAKLEDGLAQAQGPGEQSRSSAGHIGRLVGLGVAERLPAACAPDGAQQLRDQSLASLAGYFGGLAEQSPALILLEDLHWADDSSLDALNYIAQALKAKRVMIVCAARPSLFERRPHWGEGQPFHSRLVLEPLSRWDSRRLVAEILQKVDEVPQALRDLVVAGAEGNPFFIEELIRMLIEDGVVVTGEERWFVEAGRLAEIPVPPTLTAVLQARLDRLPAEERAVLQEASVVGRVFWDQAVARIHASSGGDASQKVEDHLAALRAREMIFQRETSAFAGTQEYIFQHALLREITYESVLRRLRRAYHGVVADWLLEQAGARAGELTGLIADHLEMAGRTEQAVENLLHAGDQARSLYAHPEAVRAYMRALGLLKEMGDDERAAQTLMKLGLVYTAAFEPDRAREAYDHAFELWKSPAGSTGQTEEPAPAAVLHFAVDEPFTLDPGLISDDISQFVAAQLFEGLVRVDAVYNVLPAAAARWTVTDGGRRYLFRLREGLCWSDARPLSAGDFERAWKRALRLASRASVAPLLYVIEGARAFGQGEADDPGRVGVTAVDELTLEVRLEQPTAYLPHLLAHSIAYPLPREVSEAGEEAAAGAGPWVGNGAFRLVEWKRGEKLVLERNRFYRGPFPGNVERVECPVIAGFDTALAAYAAGALDAISLISADAGTMARASAAYRSALILTPQLSTFYLGFRVDQPPFDDVRVRKAFAHAIDREALVREVSQGPYLPAGGGFVPPGIPAHSAGISLAYDPGLARDLLTEAGYPGGRGFPAVSWFHSGGSAGEPVVPFLRQAWQQALGVDLQPQSLEWGELLERRRHDPPQLVLAGWNADYPDPDDLLRVLFHSREGISALKWKNTRFDAHVEQAARVTDQARRIALYQEADRILVNEEAVVVPLWHAQGRILAKPWVEMPRVPPSLLRLQEIVLRPGMRGGDAAAQAKTIS
jgi:ABC-type oligopeptide transport system substrate-binding subunit/class 3 adenylate cyclase